jgi:hypothetical protein
MQLVDAGQFIAVIIRNCLLTVINLTLANFFLSISLTHRIAGVLDFIHRPDFNRYKKLIPCIGVHWIVS